MFCLGLPSIKAQQAAIRLERKSNSSQTGRLRPDCHLRCNIAASGDWNHRARHAPTQKRSLDHVRSASLRLFGVHGAPHPEDAEYRRHDQARGAFLECL